jgi:hypothetical protein
MPGVVSPHPNAVAAAWDDGPMAGRWIAERLGPFGPSVGHAVPLGYAAYAVVRIRWDADPAGDRGPLTALDALIEVLAPFTGDQPVHCAMWDGWSWWYDTGTDPRENTGAGVIWSKDSRPAQEEIDRARAEARERVARERVERPDAEPLVLPHRTYHVWTGPLRAATAFRHQPQDPPSLIWPEDRSWFVGAPIYTNEIAVAGTKQLVDAVIAAASLDTRRVSAKYHLDVDD